MYFKRFIECARNAIYVTTKTCFVRVQMHLSTHTVALMSLGGHVIFFQRISDARVNRLPPYTDW